MHLKLFVKELGMINYEPIHVYNNACKHSLPLTPTLIHCHDFILQMWALSPSIFDLASKHFSPLDEVVSEVYPAVQYALLNTLYSHCSRSAKYSYHHSMARLIIWPISQIINLKDNFSKDDVVIFFH